MTFLDAALASRIAAGTMRPADVGGYKLLIANVDGTFYAMRRSCPHMGADLCKGTLDGKIVRCRMHGAAFDVSSGALIDEPEVRHFKMLSREPMTFPIKLQDDRVMVGV